ncbi:hypothetical protein CVT25_013540 [Psilocybe cyanescens]|uniref:Uncharacterized protein n=1 Tax=Psilocybe cyanescens TaxID=93625 RepID=A0A409XT01_PSICY|nr:hypothetical protein CVT25_013540 [Psilocybe cyanescens]
MLTGVVLTLVAVLFIHLMFTAQYHWPLAPVNYVLQLSGVTTLLISLIATIHVVLSATFAESERWPYMLSYIAVNVPPLDIDSNTEGWSVAERATWLVMNASTSGLIQITHIQFLTLLYPSKLEGRLIFALLGPLAVVAAVMQLLPISGNTFVYSVASAVRNVCNATLSLLFTLSLFIWGLLVNRKQAWRTDGGTAVFGCAALSLAVVSTALNFLYVHKEEEFVWLPSLMWAVVLWQSFLGWWWWVGAGSGGAFASEDENMEDKLRRQAKRDARRKEKRDKKRQTKVRAQTTALAPPVPVSASVSGHSLSGEHSASAPHLRRGVSSSSMSQNNNNNSSRSNEDRDGHALAPHRTLTATTLVAPASPGQSASASHTNSNSNSNTASASLSDTSTSATSYYGTDSRTGPIARLLPGIVYRWYTSLRHAHNAAARVQAAERVQRMREMGAVSVGVGGAVSAGAAAAAAGEGAGAGGSVANMNDEGEVAEEKLKDTDPNPSPDAGAEVRTARTHMEVEGWGWGWEGFGWRRRRRVVLDPDPVPYPDEDAAAYEMEGRGRERQRRRRNESRESQEWSSASEEDDDDDIYVSDEEVDNHSRRRRRRRVTARAAAARIPIPPPPLPAPEAAPIAATRPRSVWWWGPLWRWRLQDSTVYK